MTRKTICKSFSELTPFDLYAILRLRSEVFVVEQKCIFLDMDNKDLHCHHVMIMDQGHLLATSRLVPPGISYPEMSIGRIVSSPRARGTGMGRLLMDESIRLVHEHFGAGPVKIGAQFYLKRFYESFGFVQCSDIYDEDGIDHILMLKS